MRKWSNQREDSCDEAIIQVVVPATFKEAVLNAAHGDVADHLGVKKTYYQVLWIILLATSEKKMLRHLLKHVTSVRWWGVNPIKF